MLSISASVRLPAAGDFKAQPLIAAARESMNETKIANPLSQTGIIAHLFLSLVLRTFSCPQLSICQFIHSDFHCRRVRKQAAVGEVTRLLTHAAAVEISCAFQLSSFIK